MSRAMQRFVGRRGSTLQRFVISSWRAVANNQRSHVTACSTLCATSAQSSAHALLTTWQGLFRASLLCRTRLMVSSGHMQPLSVW